MTDARTPQERYEEWRENVEIADLASSLSDVGVYIGCIGSAYVLGLLRAGGQPSSTAVNIVYAAIGLAALGLIAEIAIRQRTQSIEEVTS